MLYVQCCCRVELRYKYSIRFRLLLVGRITDGQSRQSSDMSPGPFLTRTENFVLTTWSTHITPVSWTARGSLRLHILIDHRLPTALNLITALTKCRYPLTYSFRCSNTAYSHCSLLWTLLIFGDDVNAVFYQSPANVSSHVHQEKCSPAFFTYSTFVILLASIYNIWFVDSVWHVEWTRRILITSCYTTSLRFLYHNLDWRFLDLRFPLFRGFRFHV